MAYDVGASFKGYFQRLGGDLKKLYGYTGPGTQNRNVDKTIAANKELAEYQYSKDLEMWERANAYNSPQSQMARLREAGLNPNMVYGSGSVVGNTTSQLPHYNAPNVEYDYRSPVDLGSMISLYQNMQLRGAQIENVKASTRLTNASAVQRMEENTYGLGAYRATRMRDEGALAGFRSAAAAERNRYGYQAELADLELAQARNRMELQDAEKLFKRYRNEWMKAGVTTGDHPMLRMLIRGWNSGTLEDILNHKFD